MSVRAKIEAVIYAAEEPVTLVQLTGLFGAEALAERAQQSESANASEPGLTQPTLPLTEVRVGATAESAADDHAGSSASDAAIEEAVEHPEQVAATQADGFAEEPAPAAPLAMPFADGAEEERRQIRQREREAREAVRRVLDELIAAYDSDDRGMEIREIAGGYRVATRPEYHDAVRSFVKSLKPPMKLSLQALETLAVIAYKQPVTAPEVSEIRGVDSGGVLGSLISRKLVTTAGRKQVIGRPILYKTTREFLLRFGLKDLAELPSMEEFEKMAGELVEAEPADQLSLREAQPAGREFAGELADEPIRETQAEDALSEVPTSAAEVQAAPEHEAERNDAELAANARASVQVDDERAPGHDLPGVTRDSAGRFDIGSHHQAQSDGMRGEED